MAGRTQKDSESIDVLTGLGRELQAPLQSLVKSTSKLITDYKDRDFEYVSYKDYKKIISSLELMQRQLQRCAQTTDRILHLKQFRGGVVSNACDVNGVIASVLGVLDQRLKSSSVKVNHRLSTNPLSAAIGAVECHQVFYNIILNAIQSMPAGGKIVIRSKKDKASGMVECSIQDEGVGIPPEYMHRVFEPFFTTQERGVDKNFGFGLSIANALVTGAQGYIQIESSLRKGTMVRVVLPASDGSHA